MAIDIEDARNNESTRRWLASLLDLWGRAGVTPSQVETLVEFCTMVDKTPDEIINECLRAKSDGDTFVLRTRARKAFMEQIEQFEAQTASRDRANIVRSFFIHNGVAMNPHILV